MKKYLASRSIELAARIRVTDDADKMFALSTQSVLGGHKHECRIGVPHKECVCTTCDTNYPNPETLTPRRTGFLLKLQIWWRSLFALWRKATMVPAPPGHDWKPDVRTAPDPAPYGTYDDEKDEKAS